MPVPHQVPNEPPIVGDFLRPLAVTHPRRLHDGLIVSHHIDETDEPIVEHGNLLPTKFFNLSGIRRHGKSQGRDGDTQSDDGPKPRPAIVTKRSEGRQGRENQRKHGEIASRRTGDAPVFPSPPRQQGGTTSQRRNEILSTVLRESTRRRFFIARRVSKGARHRSGATGFVQHPSQR